jgi:hypothetical protein
MMVRQLFVLLIAILLTGVASAEDASAGAQCGSASAFAASVFDPQAPSGKEQDILASASGRPALTMTSRTASADDVNLIGDTLQTYRDGFNGRNLSAVKQVWPSLDSKRETKFKEVFEFFRKDSLTPHLGLSCATPGMAGDQASVRCFQTLAYSDKKGKCHHVQPVTVSIQMERGAQAWVIESMKAQDHK